MEKKNIYVIQASDALTEHCHPFSAYTSFEEAKKVCGEKNRHNDELEADYRKLEDEYEISYDLANERVLNNYLKKENPELFDAVQKINAVEGDLGGEEYAILDAYENAMESFLNLGDEIYRENAAECGYPDSIIYLLLRSVEYNMRHGQEYFYVSSYPITLYISEEQ